MTTYQILEGDVRERLRDLPADSVHTCCTSPPFYNLRAYNTMPQIWGSTAPDCQHDFAEVWTPNQNCGAGVTPKPKRRDRQHLKELGERLGCGGGNRYSETAEYMNGRDGGPLPEKVDGPRGRASAFCRLCGCWKGELGSEPTPELFTANLVEVFREVRRVLRPDGLLFVNLADSFSGSGGAGGDYNAGGLREGQPKFVGTARASRAPSAKDGYGKHNYRQDDKSIRPIAPSIRPKSLIGIPQRFALAMVDDGWIWRAELPWIKRNPMPSSAGDRPSVSHEWFLMFSREEKYFWDMDAVRSRTVTPATGNTWEKRKANGTPMRYGTDAAAQSADRMGVSAAGRSYRTADMFYSGLDEAIEEQRAYLAHLEKIRADGGLLLDEGGDPMALCINTQGSSLEHYAGYPVKLVDPLIRAATSERGVCEKCGAPWVRKTKDSPAYAAIKARTDWTKQGEWVQTGSNYGKMPHQRTTAEKITTGWSASCSCNAGTVPAVVLDPFSGTASTGAAALRRGRSYVGIELNGEYAEMSRKRLASETQQVRMTFDEPDPAPEPPAVPSLFDGADLCR
jgi:DNA modification methylase